MRRGQVVVTPTDIMAEFAKLEDRRRLTETQLEEWNTRLAGLSIEASKTRAIIKECEAILWANGGAGKVVIDGKNEKLREAQFVLAAREDKALTGAYADLGLMEANIDAAERAIANFRTVIRGIDYSMQMKIEEFQFLNTPRFYRAIGE